MRIFKKEWAMLLAVTVLTGIAKYSCAQDPIIKFGKEVNSQKIFSKSKEKDKNLLWINVNTAPETWTLQKDVLVCSGHPIGVMRSEKQYGKFHSSYRMETY
ncbi:MAG: hypothetical protein LLG13_15370 [Bacteroidales bacterium]|nr:hypothetical protein [Bacteroidales bacterium]